MLHQLIIFYTFFQEAFQCLNEHTNKIKTENRQLRHELLLLIRKTRALHEHKTQLEEQKGQLLMEQQYAGDLKMLRSARQHKVLKGFGMLEEGEKEWRRGGDCCWCDDASGDVLDVIECDCCI